MSERDGDLEVRALARDIASECGAPGTPERFVRRVDHWEGRIRAVLAEREAENEGLHQEMHNLETEHREELRGAEDQLHHALGELARVREHLAWAERPVRLAGEDGCNVILMDVADEIAATLASSPLGERAGAILATAKLTVRAWRELSKGSEPTKWRAELESGCLPQLAAEVDALELGAIGTARTSPRLRTRR